MTLSWTRVSMLLAVLILPMQTIAAEAPPPADADEERLQKAIEGVEKFLAQRGPDMRPLILLEGMTLAVLDDSDRSGNASLDVIRAIPPFTTQVIEADLAETIKALGENREDFDVISQYNLLSRHGEQADIFVTLDESKPQVKQGCYAEIVVDTNRSKRFYSDVLNIRATPRIGEGDEQEIAVAIDAFDFALLDRASMQASATLYRGHALLVAGTLSGPVPSRLSWLPLVGRWLRPSIGPKKWVVVLTSRVVTPPKVDGEPGR